MTWKDERELLISALQQISRGHECKRPMPALCSQSIAKSALRQVGLDWVGKSRIKWSPPTDGTIWYYPETKQ